MRYVNGRKILATVMLVVCIIAVSGCGNSDQNVLNVYNWGDYIDQSVLKTFEEETGIKVNYEMYATNEDMYVKLRSGGVNYDVIIPSDYMIEKMIKENMLNKLNINNIPNIKNIEEQFKGLDYDPNDEYSVPYMWGTVGILYNKQMVKEPVDSWDILWNSKYKKQVLMLDSQRDSIAVALKKLGYSMNTRNMDELNEAKQELIKQRDVILAYVGDEVKDKMINEEAALAVVWSGDAVYMKQENPSLEYAIPKEGTNLWFDALAIPKSAQHKEEAEKFIDFLCRPDIALKNTQYIGYSTPNKETKKQLSQERINDKAAYPTKEQLENAEIFLDPGDFIKTYDKVWTEVKLGGN